MWFGKSIIAKLGFVVALAVPAFAADVEPFHFANGGSTHDSQQAFWDNLMKYKIFGEQGIAFIGQTIRVTDSSGWFGTANGNFDMTKGNDRHIVGGPILIGGDIILSNGLDTLTTGPVRVTGNVRLGYSTWSGDAFGVQCITGTVDPLYSAVIDNNFGTACPDTIPEVNRNLTVPSTEVAPANWSNVHAKIDLDKKLAFIDVPAGEGMYDFYVDGIQFHNNSILVIRMPYKGRLTRVFVKNDIDFGATTRKVRIVYMDSLHTYSEGSWNDHGGYDGTGGWASTGYTFDPENMTWSVANSIGVDNIDYAGNLLFYSAGNLTYEAASKTDSIQGTFILGGKILIKQFMTLAGQLLGKNVEINAFFDGSGFRYVPFDPDTLNIDPKAISGGKFPENNEDALVPIKLDSKAQVDVHFNYCFDVVNKGAGYAEKADFQITTLAPLPICGQSTKSVTIKRDAYEPADDQKIYINVWKDGVKETDEKLILKISNLTGAVMPNNLRDGEFELTIADMNGPEFNDKVKSYDVKERTAVGTEFAKIPVKNIDLDDDEFKLDTLIVGGKDSAAASKLFKFELVREAINVSGVYDTAYVKMTVASALDYETLAKTKTSFELMFRLKQGETVSDSSARTINVLDVNEVPTIDKIYDPKLALTAGAFDTLRPKENSKKGDTVGVVNAVDPDIYNVIAYGHLDFSIVETGFPFEMKDSVIVVNDASKMNHETKDSVYTFTVKVDNCEMASDGSWTKDCLTATHKVTVKIENIPEPPVLECFDDDDNCLGPYLAIENSKIDSVIHIFHVSDPDIGQLATLVPKIIDKKTNKEAVLFYADISHDTLSIKVKKNIDYETNDAYFNLTISVTDKDLLDTSIDRRINIQDVNETPQITGVTDLNKDYTGTHTSVYTIYPKENLKKGDSVGVVVAKDPDTKNVVKFGHLEYEILDPNGTVPFEMRNDTIVVKYPDSLNFELSNIVKYVFDVKVTNCEWNPTTNKPVSGAACLETTQPVTVMIQNVPEPPTIECKDTDTPAECNGPYYVEENSPLDMVIHEFIVKDPDKGQIATMAVSLTDNATGGKAGDYFYVYMKGDTLKLAVKSNINYEILKASYDVKLTVTDVDGGTASIDRVINLVDVNEAPVFANADTTISVKENTPDSTVVGKLPASDPDIKNVKKFGHLEYSIIDRVTKNIPFDMDSNAIIVTDVKALDYEALLPTASFTFYVQVKNCELNSTSGKYDGACLYDIAKVSLNVTDVDEPPIIVPPGHCVGDSCVPNPPDTLCVAFCDDPPPSTGDTTKILTLSVKENSPTNYVVFDYWVVDEDVGVNHKDTLVATMKDRSKSGADSLFKIGMKKVNGEWRMILSVKDGSKLDYEKVKDTHHLTVYVKDPDDKTASMGDSLRRIVKIVDVNEAPTITGVTDFNKDIKETDKAKFTFYPKENMKNDEAIGIVLASDPDTIHKNEFARLEYSVVDPNGDIPFAMKDSLLVVKDASKMDYESSKTEYKFDVQVDNCEWEKSGSIYVKTDRCLDPVIKTVTVKIQNVNEPPIIVIDGPDDPDGEDDSDSLCVAFCDTTSRGVTPTDTLTVGVKENPENPNGTRKIVTPTGMILFQYHVADEDTNHATGAKVSWFDVGTSVPSVSKKGSDLFTISYDSVAHVITVKVKDEKLLDYEALRNAKTRNDPDPEYTMGIVVTDPKGMADTLYRTIRVTDENEKPLFDVWPLVITENNKINDSLGHVEHPSDIDSLSKNPELYDNGFKMTGGDTALFWLDKDSTDLMRVMIRANVVLDCENGEYTCGQDSMYWVYMTYGDTTLKTTYTDLKIPVKLIDLDEAPEILTDTIGVDENSPKGTVIDSIKWFDIDRFDTVMTFKIAKDPTGCFEINSHTGVVSVKRDKCPGLDYEKNPTVKIDVAITDLVDVPDSLYDDNCKCQLISAKNGPITTTKTIEVNIHDVNEPPSISDKTIAVPESTTVWTVIDTVKATDPDKKKEYRDLTYTIVDGDSAVFMIDPKKGIVILKDTLDYESKKEYVIYVQVDDGEFYDTAKVKINVTNVIEKSEVIITKYENPDTLWNYPDTVYTNKKDGVITWRQDGEIVSADTTLKKGKNVIVITYKDPSKDLPGKDTVVIMYNDEIPLVEVTANPTHVKAENVFTIVENTGSADTNIYVNKERDSVYVHVKDPANKRDTSFALEVNLEPVKVSDATLKKINSIADSKIMLDETPSGGVTRTAVNSDSEKRSYVQLVGSDTVTVSYMVTLDGEPIKVPVINSKGKEESVEVITVTYKTMVGDQEVEVSYIADAMTGEIYAKGPNGELMVQGVSSKSSKSGKGKDPEKNSNVSEGIFSVTTVKIDQLGSPMVVSYAIDEKGNMVKNAEGDIGYAVTYSYKNIYGNIATESVFIVLDQTVPTVEILSPVMYSVVRSNFVDVKWTVNGIEQDSLVIQGLEKGPNIIVRFYRDKAGNTASDTVSVMMKDSKSVAIAVEQPVTEIDKDKVEEYYSVNPPKKGQTFAVSVKNPSTGKEVETMIGGHVKNKEGSGEEPYPGMEEGHLGPTLALDIKLPVIVPKEGYGTVSGLATLDDLVVSDGMIPLEGVDADNATKISVEEYVEKFCEDGVKVPSDISQFNLYDSRLHAKIWVYTSLGGFVDYFNFKQDLNDPSFTDEAGVLKLYFEQKPDKHGFVKADNGKQYATGAYVYKVEATIRSKLRCTLPSADFDAKLYKETGDGFGRSAKRKGDVIKNKDELLKSFGYRRPQN